MKFYNTLSGLKEDFHPSDTTVKLYVCGITPYAPSHIGHAMFSIVFDVIRRYLEFKGYEVKHVQNFTDIDDKMIKASSEEGITTTELSERYIEAYLREIHTLNVLPAHVYPKATQEIDKIIDIIESLIENGFAYNQNGDVYFRISANDEYGKLSQRNVSDLLAGARVEIDDKKEHPSDFALWKSRKPNEPSWPSPWGHGRPGWHIECTAMVTHYLGETIDIHGGGQDLIFPHHENEIAQSEAYSNTQPFSRFWLHNGFLQFGENKMSKSLGNIINVSDLLEKYSPDAIRLFFLNSHYRSPVVYSEEALTAQERASGRLKNAITLKGESKSQDILNSQPFVDRFVAAMDDDINTPRALAAIFDLVRDINRGHEEALSISHAQLTLRELTKVLGLKLDDNSKIDRDINSFIQLLIDLRSGLRESKQYTLADNLRKRMTELGVILEDTAQGTKWKFTRR